MIILHRVQLTANLGAMISLATTVLARLAPSAQPRLLELTTTAGVLLIPVL